MTAVVFGTSAFAVPILERAAERVEVVAVVTQPDRPAGRGHKLAPTPVKTAALERGLRVETPERLKPFAETLRALAPEVCIVASYGKIVPQVLLDTVPLWLNVHPSLLPLYRGATPLQTAIRDGRDQTGVSIIAMDAGMDTGDVVVAETAPIAPRETYGELHDRLALRGAELLVTALDAAAAGRLQRTPQAELARERGISAGEIAASTTRPLHKDDLTIDWGAPAKRIVDHVRSLAPQPLARARWFDEQLKIVEAHLVPVDELLLWGDGVFTDTSDPGFGMRYVGNRAMLCGTAADGEHVVVTKLIAPNRGPISGEAYARAWRDRTEAVR